MTAPSQADRARAKRLRQEVLKRSIAAAVARMPGRGATPQERREWRARFRSLRDQIEGHRADDVDDLDGEDDGEPERPFGLSWQASTGGRHSGRGIDGVIGRVRPTGVGGKYRFELHAPNRLLASGTAGSADHAKVACDSAYRRKYLKAEEAREQLIDPEPWRKPGSSTVGKIVRRGPDGEWGSWRPLPPG